MSEKTKKASKAPRTNLEKNNCLTSLASPKTLKNVCFPEWADDEVNLLPNSVVTSPTGKPREKIEKLEKSKKTDKTDELARIFEDSQVLFLPLCFRDMVQEWKRPGDIFIDYQFVIYKDDSHYSELLNGSAHLVTSAFVRSFISNILNLEHLAKTTNFCQEATTFRYIPNTSGHWKPWHHIYGTSKVGPNTVHNPQVNPMGRYSVRLFWLGAWRRVVIDDFLPVDATGHVLLPSFPIPKKPSASVAQAGKLPSAGSKDKDKHKGQKSEKEIAQPVVVLWPFLLSKALLKLANLTMKNDKELLDFNIAHSLTGWVLQKVDLKGLRSEDVWEICKKHASVYSWNKEEEAKHFPVEKKSAKKGKEASKTHRQTPRTSDNSYCLMALCTDLRYPKQNAVNGISPCWGHEIVIDECRDIPLERPPPEPEYPAWKNIRWMEWAKSKGIITEHVPMDTTRYLKCFSPFKKFAKHVVYKEPEEEEKSTKFPLRKSIGTLMKLPEKQQLQEDVSDTQKSSGPKEKKKQMDHPPPDPIMWLQFEELCANLDSIHVFYKPTSFTHKSRVSDLELNGIVQSKQNKTNSNDTWQDVTWTNTVRERGNAPLYFFIDSLESKMILINLEQTGDQKRLLPLEDELSEKNFFFEYERLFGDHAKGQEEIAEPPKKMKLNRARIHADPKKSNVVFEEFRWDTAETGKVRFFLNTYGSCCSIMELEPGRHIYRVWIKSWNSYCITMLSDTKFSLGCFESILENIVEEPMRMTRFSLNISHCFAMLVQSFRSAQFANRLHDYHRCYLPEDSLNKLSKLERTVLHEAFHRALHQYIQYKQNPDSAQKTTDALRVLFVNKNIRIPVRKEVRSTVYEPFQFQSYQERKICEKAATKLQAFFKGIQVRKLLSKHHPNSRHSSLIFEVLRSLYSEYFSLEKREPNLGNIIRNFLQDEHISGFLNFYDFSADSEWDVSIQTFTGISDSVRGYVVLCRFLLKCCVEVLLAMHLFCSINNYVLRIINNDNTEEIHRFTNYVCPAIFKPNSFGYTVTAFAWCDEISPVNWKLALISSRNTISYFEIEEMPTTTFSVFDNYVPLCENLIGKHSISVKENVIFTLRFSCSYEDVRFKMNLYDPSRRLMMDLVGVQKIVLPAVLLKYSNIDVPTNERANRNHVIPSNPLESYTMSKKESSVRKIRDGSSQVSISEPQIYSLEIYVVEKSWPLTTKEWGVVRKLREEMYFLKSDLSRDTSNELFPSRSLLRTSRESKKNNASKTHTIERPWYLLQYSLMPKEQAVLTKNKEEEEKILSMKKSWYKNDPGRYTKSLELRHKYLERYLDPGCQCPEEFNKCSNEESMSKFTDLYPENDSRLVVSKEEEEDDVERNNICPRWTEAEIPKFDLSPYLRPHNKDFPKLGQRIVKTEEDHKKDEAERQRMIEEYNDKLQKGAENMELWINETKERVTLVFSWYADCRKESEKIYREDNLMRQDYFEKWAAETSPAKTPTKKERKTTPKK